MDEKQKRSWWSRNWKWVVPVGCLFTVVLFISFVALILFLVFGLLKSSDAYKDALAKAKSHPAVRKTLGTPIEEGLFVTGSINISGLSERASLAIPISGPKDRATIYVEAEKTTGTWSFSKLVVEINSTSQRINLLREKVPEPVNPDDIERKKPGIIIINISGKTAA